ncbi:MAG: NAD-dependent epimerase/dehydratase family protein [Microscillaceae bacterium]
MEKILILGASGNIGRAVLSHLSPDKAEIYAGLISEEEIPKISSFPAKPILVNFMDANSLQQVLEGMTRVFLVTPLMPNPEQATAMLIEAANHQGIKHIVRSTAAGADSKSPYTFLRLAGLSEELLKDSGIPYIIIRPGTFLQNFINWSATTTKSQHAFYQAIADARMCMLDLDNLGEVVALSMQYDAHLNQTYTLSGHIYRQTEIAEILSELLNRKISYVPVSQVQYQQSLEESQTPAWMIEALSGLNEATIQGLLEIYSDDYQKITGKAYTTAQEFLARHLPMFL